MYTVYSINNCGYCNMAKSILKQKGLDYQEFNVNEQPEKMQELLKKVPTARTFPQIFYKEDYIGGFNDLKQSF